MADLCVSLALAEFSVNIRINWIISKIEMIRFIYLFFVFSSSLNPDFDCWRYQFYKKNMNNKNEQNKRPMVNARNGSELLAEYFVSFWLLRHANSFSEWKNLNAVQNVCNFFFLKKSQNNEHICCNNFINKLNFILVFNLEKKKKFITKKRDYDLNVRND